MRDRVFPGLAVVGGPPRRRLGRQPPRREEPPHRMGLGHRAEDPPRAGTAGTDEDPIANTRRSNVAAGSFGAATGAPRYPESGRSVSYMYAGLPIRWLSCLSDRRRARA